MARSLCLHAVDAICLPLKWAVELTFENATTLVLRRHKTSRTHNDPGGHSSRLFLVWFARLYSIRYGCCWLVGWCYCYCCLYLLCATFVEHKHPIQALRIHNIVAQSVQYDDGQQNRLAPKWRVRANLYRLSAWFNQARLPYCTWLVSIVFWDVCELRQGQDSCLCLESFQSICAMRFDAMPIQPSRGSLHFQFKLSYWFIASKIRGHSWHIT